MDRTTARKAETNVSKRRRREQARGKAPHTVGKRPYGLMLNTAIPRPHKEADGEEKVTFSCFHIGTKHEEPLIPGTAGVEPTKIVRPLKHFAHCPTCGRRMRAFRTNRKLKRERCKERRRARLRAAKEATDAG